MMLEMLGRRNRATTGRRAFKTYLQSLSFICIAHRSPFVGLFEQSEKDALGPTNIGS